MIGLTVIVKAMDVVWILLVGEYSRVVSTMWVSLVSLILHFPKEPCLSPDLSGWKVEMQKQIFYSSPAVLHLFQNCLDLASMSYIGKVSNRAWKQRDLLIGFLRAQLFSKNVLMKVPIG